METTLVERHQLKNIENRLENVEKSLSEILENGEMMEERIKEKLAGIHDEIENNNYTGGDFEISLPHPYHNKNKYFRFHKKFD